MYFTYQSGQLEVELLDINSDPIPNLEVSLAPSSQWTNNPNHITTTTNSSGIASFLVPTGESYKVVLPEIEEHYYYPDVIVTTAGSTSKKLTYDSYPYVYPQDILITGDTAFLKSGTLVASTTTQEVTGQFTTEWTSNLEEYITLTPNGTSCSIAVHTNPEEEDIAGQITVQFKKLNGEVLAEKSIDVIVQAMSIAFTSEENGSLLAAFYNEGLCESDQFITKKEMQAITSDQLKTTLYTHHEENNVSDIISLDELKFLIINEIKSSTFRYCTNVTVITLPQNCSLYRYAIFENKHLSNLSVLNVFNGLIEVQLLDKQHKIEVNTYGTALTLIQDFFYKNRKNVLCLCSNGSEISTSLKLVDVFEIDGNIINNTNVTSLDITLTYMPVYDTIYDHYFDNTFYYVKDIVFNIRGNIDKQVHFGHFNSLITLQINSTVETA